MIDSVFPFPRGFLPFLALLGALITPRTADAQSFTDLTDSSGAAGSSETCGIGTEDFDGDGLLDLCVTNVGGGSSRLYHNNGNGTFTDVSGSAGISGEAQVCTFGDVDNDGDTDLFLGFYWSASRLYGNDGTGLFANINSSSGVSVQGNWCMSSFADIDNDGDLDLFISRSGGNYLYVNNGSAVFTNEAAARGLLQSGLSNRGASFGDVDNDGDLDLFLGSYDVTKLFTNNGSGYFSDGSSAAGLGGLVNGEAVAFADIDNDGDLDLLFTRENISARLFQNDGTGVFTEISGSSGISSVTAGNGCTFGDYDNDGDLDLFLAGGDIAGTQGVNYLFRNDGANVFTEIGTAAGVRDVTAEHRGALFFDMDNDGDLDLYVGRKLASAGHKNNTYRNDLNNGNYLKIRVRGTTSNRSAIGAKISVYTAGHLGEPAYLLAFRQILAAGGYASTPPLLQHFGLSALATYDLVIRFPGGTIINRRGISAGQTLTILESDSSDPAPSTTTTTPITVGGTGCGSVGLDLLLLPLAWTLLRKSLRRPGRWALFLVLLLAPALPAQEPTAESPAPAAAPSQTPAVSRQEFADSEETPFATLRAGIWTYSRFRAETPQGTRTIRGASAYDLGLEAGFPVDDWETNVHVDFAASDGLDFLLAGFRFGRTFTLEENPTSPLFLNASIGPVAGRLEIDDDDFGDFEDALGWQAHLELRTGMFAPLEASVWAEYRDIQFEFDESVTSGDDSAVGPSLLYGISLTVRF